MDLSDDDNIVLSKWSSKRKNISDEKNEINPKALNFKPHCFLQCHSREDDPKDFSQQVWCCRFHPKLKNIVATCGGENLCMIDCSTAKVRARFAQPNEEFYTLDWTTIRLNDTPSHIIACGGCLGFIYLIHTEQFCTYGYFKAHNKPVQTLAFMDHCPTYLLSAGNDKKIYLWDIGVPSLPEYNFAQKKLAIFENLMYSPLKMLPLNKGEHILCASEGGLFCWNVPGGFNKSSEPKRHGDITEIKFPFVEGSPVVDGLAAISDDLLVTKCAQSGVIFLWKCNEVLKKVKSGVNKVTASICCELKWSNTEQLYINVNVCSEKMALITGDDNGSIWIYDCSDLGDSHKVKKQKPSLLPGKLKPPSHIVPWPICTRINGQQIPNLENGMVFNDLCSNKDMQYIVVAADNNLVCIYKSVE